MAGNYAVIGSTGMEAYHKESAERCCLHDTCDCCTCRCCGLCILILWVIFGAINAIIASSTIGNLNDYAVCPPNTGDITGECCSFKVADTEYVIDGSCDPFKTNYEISIANNILACIAGVAGIVGLSMFVAWLLWVPIGYSIISVILGIVGLALIGFGGFVWVEIPSIVIAACIIYLFWMNYKIMRDTAPQK